MSEVVVQARGMATSLGGCVQACAAFRAGLNRFRPSREFKVFYQGDDEPQAVATAALPDPCFGFTDVGRLVVITMEALRDLKLQSILDPSVSVFLALPDPLEREMEEGYDQKESSAERIDGLGLEVLHRAFSNLGVRFSPDRTVFRGGGHMGFAFVLKAAIEQLQTNAIRQCLVGAVDSTTGPRMLDRLLADERLKTHANPVGVIPGEGGAFLLLSRNSTSSIEGSRVSMDIEYQQVSGDDEISNGAALGNCIVRLLERTSEPRDVVSYFGDCTGEPHRASEWGRMLSFLQARGLWQGSEDVSFPATSFGSLGVAAGGIAACIALRRIEQNYAPGKHAVITLASDEGYRAAISIRPFGRLA